MAKSMCKTPRILQLAILTALLTSCAGNTAGLWGVQSTPTPLIQPSATPSLTPPPSPSPTASLTPLAVLPDPETLTPEPTATESAPTLTAEPSGIPEQVSPTPLTPTATLPPINTAGPMDVYQSQGGDTLNIVARRFNLKPEQIIAGVVLPPPDELIPPNTLLLVPKTPAGTKTSPQERTIPDSEIVYGPSTIGFNTADYVNRQAGYLSSYREYVLSGGWISGDGAVERLALENSLNPRMLLALIEYQSHWVLGQPTNLAESEYPLGYVDIGYQRLFRQLMYLSRSTSGMWSSSDEHFGNGTTSMYRTFSANSFSITCKPLTICFHSASVNTFTACKASAHAIEPRTSWSARR